MTDRSGPDPVRAALEHAVALGERSVHVAAYADGELIVDARIGPAPPDAVYPVFSVSKAFTALAVHLQAERGLLDLHAPLADVWPEYAAHGKQEITPALVLSHRAGVPQMPSGMTPERLGDWDSITAALAGLTPRYAPDTVNAYHSMSFGYLLGEAVRRSDPENRDFARFVGEELCDPLGIDSLWFGIPDDVGPRVVELAFPDPPPPPPPGAEVLAAVPPAVGLIPEVFNRGDVQRACVPAVGAIADARGAARMLAVLAGHGSVGDLRLLSSDRVTAMLAPRPDVDGDDLVYGRPLPVGAGGLWIEAPGVTAPGRRGDVLAHPGVGGAIAWAELDLGLSVAICHDRMFAAVPEPPFAAVAEAVRQVARAR